MPAARSRTAITLRTSGSSPARRRSSDGRLAKLRERSKALARRVRESASKDSQALAAVGTSVLIGVLQKKNKLPPAILGYDSLVVTGVAGYLLTRSQKGELMGAVRSAALTAAVLGVNRSTRRGTMVVEDSTLTKSAVSSSGTGDEDEIDDDDES